ncbi:hypothetical protein FXW78_25770 [Rhodococcus opacus]|nr:hypothetical protein [Rhodococcus opacus]
MIHTGSTAAVVTGAHRGLGTAGAGGPLGRATAAKARTTRFAALGAAGVLLIGAGIDAATTPAANGAATTTATSIAAPGITPGGNSDINDSQDRRERRERREQQRADTVPDGVLLGQIVAAGSGNAAVQATPAWDVDRTTIGEGVQTDTLG